MRRGVIRIIRLFKVGGKSMRRTLLGLSLVSCLLLSSCKEDDDPDADPKGSSGDAGEDPAVAAGAAIDGTIKGKPVSCRCGNDGCVVQYEGRAISSGRAVEIDGVLVANEGRCQPLP